MELGSMGKSSLDSNVYDFPLVRGRIAITIVDTVNRQQISYIEQDNLITTEGLNAIAAGVAGTSLTPFYVMVGTGTTTPTLADTGLATADVTTWKPVTGVSALGSSVYYGMVYGSATANGTWTEIGLWRNATATANTGTLVARALVPWTKNSTQVATVNWTWTVV